MRTHLCGSLTARNASELVKLGGWVHRSRDLGGLIFMDLRDRSGLIQVSFDPAAAGPEVMKAAASVGLESVVVIEGRVELRPEEMRNPELGTGEVEVRATSIHVAGPAATPPIPVAQSRGERLPAEELRLRHRYLDLRRSDLQKNLVLRHELLQQARSFLSSRGFLEIETPVLTRPTPEGARDYLVPSRVHPGEFYALPQSPQLYKQLLMVSGYDRYFQIARCFRDEDLRADRQPEFTQIDIEASFVERDDIFGVCEELVASLWHAGGVPDVRFPFPRIPHAEALERFGTDRPDLRFGLELRDVTDLFSESPLAFVRSALDRGGRVRAILAPGAAAFSRKQIAELEEVAKGGGAGGLMYLRRGTDGGLEGSLAKHITLEQADRIGLLGDAMAFFVVGNDRVTGPSLDRVRQELARRLDLIKPGKHEFLWVTDFPLFASDADTGAIMSEHHPFTAPHPDDMHLLDGDPLAVRSLAYDTVYNGLELSSGSIRISDPGLQRKVFRVLGISAEDAARRFGFLLEGLQSGAPPHGGIAFGFDRIAMLLAGATSLRDVIAFPKTTAARALFEGAPAAVPGEDLRALHIALKESSV